MKIRLVLLSLLGVAAYIVLANYNSKMIKDNPVPKEHAQGVVPQTHPVKKPAPEAAPENRPALQGISAVQQRQPVQTAAPQAPPTKEPGTTALKATELPPGPASQPQLANPEQLSSELAQKEQQIRQLLDAQDTVAAQYRQLLARSNAEQADTAAKNSQLQEARDRITALNADKENMASELAKAKISLEQQSGALEKLKASSADAEQAIKEKESQFKTAHQQIEQQTGETDTLKAQLAETLTQSRTTNEELAKSQQALKEKEVLLNAAQQQLQQQTGETSALKGQLTTAATQLQAATAERATMQQALKERETLFNAAQQQLQQQTGEISALKEQLTDAAAQLQAAKVGADEQKGTLEKTLQEKTAALAEATHAIRSLKQEVTAQPQAVATIQNLLDDRNKEFEQVKTETTAQIQQLRNQLTDLDKTRAQAAAEGNKYKAEAEVAQKKAAELESALGLAQTSQVEAEKKMTAALDSKNALQNQLNDKEAAISGSQVQTNELLAKITSLSDEKIGLTSQLAALQADQKNLREIKASFEKQSADLASAEGKLKELAALQTQNAELTKSLEEKTAALADAAKQSKELADLQAKNTELSAQTDAQTAAIKQMETEKADLAGQLAAAQTQAKEVETLKISLDGKTTALVQAETKIKDLANADEQIAALQKKLTDSTAALQALQSAKQATEQQAVESESALKSQGQSLIASNSKVKALEIELAAAQVRIKELMDKHHLQQQQDLIPNLNQQIATLRDQVAQMEAASVQAKNNKDEAAAAMQAKAEEAQAAEKKLQILLTEKDGLQQSLNASQASVAALQKQLDELKVQTQQVPRQTGEKLTDTAETAVGDHDKDGLNDEADLCPNSPAGTPVNALGCPAKGGLILEGVTFKSSTAIFLPGSSKTLDKVATSLRLLPQVKVEVAGYTDSVGDPKRNLELSAQRSQAVVKYLVGKGVVPEQVAAKGYGQENPVADNTTSVGKQKNRRVELHPMAP